MPTSKWVFKTSPEFLVVFITLKHPQYKNIPIPHASCPMPPTPPPSISSPHVTTRPFSASAPKALCVAISWRSGAPSARNCSELKPPCEAPQVTTPPVLPGRCGPWWLGDAHLLLEKSGFNQPYVFVRTQKLDMSLQCQHYQGKNMWKKMLG